MFVVTFGNGVKSYILDRNKNLFIDAKIETSIPEDTRVCCQRFQCQALEKNEKLY